MGPIERRIWLASLTAAALGEDFEKKELGIYELSQFTPT